jgi:uncharacterized protein
MSEGNVEIVKRGFEAYMRGDLAAAFANYDDDVVFNPAEEAPIHGREAVLSYIRRWEEPWDDYELQTEEFIDAGESVVVTIHVKARGAASGAAVDARSHQVHSLRDGKLIRMDEYLVRDEALRAAGLSG